MSKNRNRPPQQFAGISQAVAAAAPPAVAPPADSRPPSWEDFQAEVARDQAEDATAGRTEQNSAAPPDDGPNPDLTPPANLTCSDPLWECTCAESCVPKATVQAPTAELAEERYRGRFLIRRPKVTVRKI